MSALANEKLQQYFDGELSIEETSEIRAMLEAEEHEEHEEHEGSDGLDAVRAELATLGRLHDLVNLAAEASAADLDGDGMFSEISEGIAQDGGLRVIRGGGEDAGPRPKGVETWKVAFPLAAVAIAAAVLFALIGPGTQNDDSVADNVADGSEILVDIDDEHSEALVMVEAPHGSEVEEVDFGDNTGTVFAVEGEAGEPIAVVWITDEPLDEVMQ